MNRILKAPHRTTSPYGHRVHPITKKSGSFHNGVDLAKPMGEPVFAHHRGQASHIYTHPTGGLTLIFDGENGVQLRMCHLHAVCVVLLFRGCGRPTERVVERRDTTVVVRVDTLVHTQVAYRDRWRERVDTLVVEVAGDTVRVPVPIDKHIFTDDTTYRAEVSGWGVSLDRMELFRVKR